MDRRRLPRLDLHALDGIHGTAAVAADRDGGVTFSDGAVGAEQVAERTERALRFDGCDLRGIAIPSGCRELQLVECRIERLDLAGTELRQVAIRRSLVGDSRLTGIAGHVRLEDARLLQCQMTNANLRMAELERVELGDSRLPGADLYGATLDSVRFEDCDLTGVDLSAAELRRCEIARCDLAGLRGVAALAGTRIGATDLVACALELADALGIVVADE
jgi:uncharacterized protein YjbI with pentapeptide repeats